MKSVMSSQHSFAQVPQADIQRSKFDRSHGLKTTFDADKLVPILVDEVLPGDTHTLNTNIFGRLATPINPIMDNLFLETFYFFVPMRLIWEDTERFFGERDNPTDSIDYTIPQSTLGSVPEGSIADHMGLPVGVSNLSVSVLPFRAYYLIYDEWFRDQNLQNSPDVQKGSSGVRGNNTDYPVMLDLLTRGKRHDYFTSCLPWAQKGDSVNIGFGSQAPVSTDGPQGSQVQVAFPTSTLPNDYRQLVTSGSVATLGTTTQAEGNVLYADLSAAEAVSINTWRQAFQIQKFLERDARSGTRYIEKIKGHFGVTSPDARLQRPEYLGGDSQMINVHPVPQTSSTDATTPQGNLSAFGTVAGQQGGFSKSFTEHGYIIGLANVRADLTYQQGLNKLWSRETQYDFYWPVFAHLGEQAVLNKEIYAQGSPIDDQVFGYQERYAEYRYKPSLITGKFRSDASASLDAWHLSQDFDSLPTLGDTFIKSNTPLDRVIAVQDEPHIIMDCYFNYTSVRPMPVYAPPGFVDHF